MALTASEGRAGTSPRRGGHRGTEGFGNVLEVPQPVCEDAGMHTGTVMLLNPCSDHHPLLLHRVINSPRGIWSAKLVKAKMRD